MAFLIHQRRRRVPQFVNGISFSRQIRRFQTVVHILLDTPRGKALPGMLGNKKSFFVLQIRQFGALVAQAARCSITPILKKNEPLFIAFPDDPDRAVIMNIGNIDINQFTQTHPAIQKQR